jgi:hypothetical protein
MTHDIRWLRGLRGQTRRPGRALRFSYSRAGETRGLLRPEEVSRDCERESPYRGYGGLVPAILCASLTILREAVRYWRPKKTGILRNWQRKNWRLSKRAKLRLEKELTLALIPKDPNDDKDVIVEIRAGTGGEEAALFAAELFRMYGRYAEDRRWKTEILTSNPTDLGGFKEIIFAIERQRGLPAPQVRGRRPQGAAHTRNRIGRSHPHVHCHSGRASGVRGCRRHRHRP